MGKFDGRKFGKSVRGQSVRVNLPTPSYYMIIIVQMFVGINSLYTHGDTVMHEFTNNSHVCQCSDPPTFCAIQQWSW